MTAINDEHRALLLAVAKRLKDIGVRKAYSDWLQEHNNAGWMIVANYDPTAWPVWVAPYNVDSAWMNKHRNRWRGEPLQEERWKLPWLEGEYRSTKRTDQSNIRAKWVLTAYAEGEVFK